MKRPTKWERLRGTAQELGTIAHRGRQVWRLIPWRHRLSLFGALAVMSLASASNTAIWLCVGGLINGSPGSTWPSSPRPISSGSV
jgi:ATP-binding cassette subfamily B protein